MKDIDRRHQNCTVHCDYRRCHRTLDIDSTNYQEINEAKKEEGWITRTINGKWYEFCSLHCYVLTKKEEQNG